MAFACNVPGAYIKSRKKGGGGGIRYSIGKIDDRGKIKAVSSKYVRRYKIIHSDE